MPFARVPPIVLAALCLAACEKKEIETHRVPKSTAPAPADGMVEQRLLGAIVPDGDRTWFFKLMGESAAVTAEQGRFDEFVRSVKFGAGDRPVTWTPPAGWTERAGSDMRYATLAIAPGLELSVVKLDGVAGGTLANVNRWRNQLGLAPIMDADLKATCKETTVSGRAALLVDFTGHAKPGGSPPMMGGPHGAPEAATSAKPEASPVQMPPIDAPKPSAGITYSRPPEWQELRAAPPRLAVFAAGDAELVITAFPGDVGGELANVNRWRGQVGLEPTDEAGVAASRKSIKAGDLDAHCFFLDGAERAMAAAIVKNGDTSWFLKLTGPIATVTKERPNFEAFIASVRFDAGDAHDAGH